MKIISVINYKGGVGKTTITSNIAAELAYKGKKVLLLDMDAQASLTFSFVTPDYWQNNLAKQTTIKSYFDKIVLGKSVMSLADLCIRPAKVNTNLQEQNSSGLIDLIPSHLGLINVDLELAILLGGANIKQAKQNYIKVHGQLRDAIHQFANNVYDVVLIDCPPNFNIVTKNALIAADQILVPAKPDYLSTLGIDYLHSSVRQLIGDFNDYATLDDDVSEANPVFLGVIFTMIQIYANEPIAAQRQYISQTQRLGLPTFANYFRENKTIFAGAPQEGIPVILNLYNSRTHSGIVNEMEALVDEFIIKAGI